MVCLLVGIPAISYAQDYGCATVGASMESSLFDAIKNDLNIDIATIIKDKTKVEILDISPVSKVYAESLARMDYEKDKAKNKVTILDKKSYFDSYYENQVKSIVAKYTYINKDKEKDIFIASSFMNADECSVRFNGYITLSREF
ncbi:Shiga toxin A subunit [Salmonella enterica subsp. enterica]|uniref:Shiga toxin A subunit n=1 Tax=Salmonella enterica subsp. enterica serovar Macclesfield str. S-1643 TaxID=1242107 RepID=A0A2C9P6L4_SALET|nr:Shiga toxin A subunit [Salmonella enterica]EAA5488226.1 Shiga toxin A subunit [Salmonella enterica subsp. enterica serovar Kouka]EBG2396375.1 Shiga toxin A subunit [Salmonella enterica subsp. enterica serovar Everleigh]EBS1110473.1 Shiga toxin A subunit [Salmonella enterica subsp. enterica serovar Eingedi]ECH9261842.1 Shiga toxin A subunit [Salmonella enterica subsp. enterica]ASG19024.1 Shiga toxin A subunit [Salmonella enterica subsp. enterica serovar Macclesfield str. S-1643]